MVQKFEVGKKYKTPGGTTVYTCVHVDQGEAVVTYRSGEISYSAILRLPHLVDEYKEHRKGVRWDVIYMRSDDENVYALSFDTKEKAERWIESFSPSQRTDYTILALKHFTWTEGDRDGQ